MDIFSSIKDFKSRLHFMLIFVQSDDLLKNLLPETEHVHIPNYKKIIKFVLDNIDKIDLDA